MAKFRGQSTRGSGLNYKQHQGSWWIFSFLRRTAVLLFLLSLLTIFFYMLGSYQKYLDRTQLLLLGLTYRLSYLTLGTGAAHFFLSLILKQRNVLGPARTVGMTVMMGVTLGIFLITSFFTVLLLPVEGGV